MKTVDNFEQGITQYWKKGTIPKPDDESLCTLVPSSAGYAHQRVVNRNWDVELRSPELAKMAAKIKTLHGNLNYKRSEAHWKKFYTFPDAENAVRYAQEENLSASRIVNFNEGAPQKLYDELLAAAEIGGFRMSKVQFLTGTTGVGKTTFLKYFSKLYRKRLFCEDMIISRVRFRDIQDFNRNNKVDLLPAFQTLIINCLVRDLAACAEFELKLADAHGEPELLSDAMRKQDSIREAIDESLLDLDELEGFDLEGVLDEFEDDEHFLHELPEQQKCQLVMRLRQKFNFCIVLDGFDAMRPEEIALFDDPEAHAQADFFRCLSTILRNSMPRNSSLGRCLKKINKTYLVAARPITITQLKDEIEGETDHDVNILQNLHVVGTSIAPLLENRLTVHFEDALGSKAQMRRFRKGVLQSVQYVMALVREEHAAIQPGRFIDLFNHNIREKVRFLADVVDLLAFKVEDKYRRDYSSIDVRNLEKLSIEGFLTYLEDPEAELGLEIYEIQKTLILNKEGYFKNFFHHNVSGELIPEALRGQFDNIFNYENRELFDTSDPNSEGYKQYAFSKDPLLEKFFVLFRLSKDDSLAETVLRKWFSENFVHQSVRDTTLRQLIRNGTIIAEYIDDVVFLRLSPKGRFTFDELCGVSVYLEHVVLNCQVPHFLSKSLIKPTDPERRVWGRHSITNITLFLNYVESIIMQSVKLESQELKTELLLKVRRDMKVSVINSFRGMIVEGISREVYRDYATDLRNELKGIGV